MTNWLKVDFHCHTEYSRDSLTRIRDLWQAGLAAGLDRVVITDHNGIEGALRACEMAPDFFIPGEEVLTDRGELLAAYVTREVPRHTPWREALDQLRAQGAFISVSHPFDLQRHGWPLEQLEELVGQVDAIEVLNARCLSPHINQMAKEYALAKGLAGTAGSDAHTPAEVGRCHLVLPEFADAQTLRQAMTLARPAGSLSPFRVHLYSSYARWRKQIGWWTPPKP